MSRLIDMCVVCGSNLDSGLAVSKGMSSSQGPYRQHILAVVSSSVSDHQVAYFPLAKTRVDGHPYYKPSEVLCPKAQVDTTDGINRFASTDGSLVLPHSMEVVQNLTTFCFPSGGYVYSKPQPAKISYQVFTNMNGANTYATYITCTRQYNAVDHVISKEQTVLNLVEADTGGDSESFVVYAPLCICLISEHPYFNTMKDCLSSLVPYLTLPENELWSEVMCLAKYLTQILVPPPGPLLVEFSVLGNSHYVGAADEATRRIIDIDLHIPLMIFSPEDIVLILTCILTQQRLIFISSEYALLASIIETFMCYIDPMKWRLPYVPVLPDALVDLMEATGSFIMGVHSSLRPQVRQVRKNPESEIVLVDIDKGAVCIDAHHKVPAMPDHIAQSLVVRLKKSAWCFDVQQISQPTFYSLEKIQQARREFLNNFKSDIKEIFLDMLVSLFGDIYNHITDNCFDGKAYLKSKSEDEQEFFTNVCESDSFNIFVDDRISFRHYRDAFLILGERMCSDKKINHSKTVSLQKARKSTHLGAVFRNGTNTFKIQDFDLSLDARDTYKVYISDLTQQIELHSSGQLHAIFRYMRGLALIASEQYIDGLRDLYSLYSSVPEIFPTEYVKQVHAQLSDETIAELSEQRFYQDTAMLRRLSLNAVNTTNSLRNFTKPSRPLSEEDFLKSLMTLKVTTNEKVIGWLFQKLVIESDGQTVSPEHFTSLYKTYAHFHSKWDDRKVGRITVETDDKILRVTNLVYTSEGMGHLVLTTDELLFVHQDVQNRITVIAKLNDVKEITKHQQFSVNFLTGVEALKVFHKDPRKGSFWASLKENRNLWYVLLCEMVAGQRERDKMKDQNIVEQAASNVILVQTLLAMGFQLPVLSGLCVFSLEETTDTANNLTEETRESLLLRIDPWIKQGKRGTVMSLVFVPQQQSIWCGLGSGVIVVYNTETWSSVAELRIAKSRISALRVVNGYVWAGSFDSVIYIINTDTTQTNHRLHSHYRSVSDIAIDDYSPEKAWSSGFDGQIFCWDTRTHECVTSFTLKDVRTLARIIPTARRELWCVSQDNIFVVDTASADCPVLRTFPAPDSPAGVKFGCALRMSERELWVAGSKVPGVMFVWNTETYQSELVAMPTDIEPRSMSSAHGSVWVGDKDGRLFQVSPATKHVEREMHAHTGFITCVCALTNGCLATGSSSRDGQVCVWSANMGYEVIDGVRRRKDPTNNSNGFVYVQKFFR